MLFATAVKAEKDFPKTSELLCDAAGLLISKDCEINRLKTLLAECAPHVIASHGALHMLEGFTPKPMPIDNLVKRMQDEGVK